MDSPGVARTAHWGNSLRDCDRAVALNAATIARNENRILIARYLRKRSTGRIRKWKNDNIWRTGIAPRQEPNAESINGGGLKGALKYMGDGCSDLGPAAKNRLDLAL